MGGRVGVLLLLLGGSGCFFTSTAEGRMQADSVQSPSGNAVAPNVIVILVDALRADRLNATRNGLPVMPYLLDMAANGVWFTNAVAPCSWTRPSMASIFTGIEVEAHEVSTPSDALPATIETMASFLKTVGYSTMGVQTNGNLTHELGFGQGFDEYGYYGSPEASAEQVTNAALQQVQRHTQPFFLYAHYMDPHVPYLPPQQYRSLFGYPAAGLSTLEQGYAEDFIPYTLDQVDFTLGIKPVREFPELSAIGKDSVETLYDGEARYADAEIGGLIDTLLAQYPNTFVIVLADHGEHFWEHGLLGHGLSLYEPELRVPLFIKGPGLAQASIATNVSTVDVLPTVAALLGLSARPAWQGRSLLATRNPLDPVFSYTRGARSPRDMDFEAVREGSMKLIHNRRTDAVALYDIVADPLETTNLAVTYPELVIHLRALLDTQTELNIRARVRTGVLTISPNGFIEESTRVTMTAPPGSNYRWFKNGVLIADAPERVTGACTRTLTLNPTLAEDSGTYECEYDDGVKGLRFAQAHVLDVLPPNSVPAASLGGLALLAVLLGGMAARCHSVRDKGQKVKDEGRKTKDTDRFILHL